MAINADIVRRFVQTTMQSQITLERELLSELPVEDQVETALVLRTVCSRLWERMAETIVQKLGPEITDPILQIAEQLAEEAILTRPPSAQA